MPSVGEIMSGDVLAVATATPLREAAGRMHERRVGALVVLEFSAKDGSRTKEVRIPIELQP